MILGQPFRDNYSRVINILIFSFPIVINSMQVVGDVILFILAMMGIFISVSQKLSPFLIKEIKVVSYLAFGYFISICLSVVFSGQALNLAHYIPRDFYFLFAPFIALALFKAEINVSYLIAGVKVSLLVLGVIVLSELSKGVVRPSGVMNAGVFGNLAVSLFFISLAFFQHESFKNKIFTFLSLLSGIFIIIESGTRGSWLSFILLLLVYLSFMYWQKTKFSALIITISVIFLAGIVAVSSLNNNITDRFGLLHSQASSWLSGDDSPNPISLRLVMYKKAIENVGNVPFFGHGLRTSNIALFKNDPSSIGIVAARFNHLHNAYLTNYYNGGIFLLGALLLLLFVPLRIFIKANSQNRENPLFTAGILLVVGYAAHGMVNILLGDTYMNGFYVFFLIIFLLLTNKSLKLP